MNWKTINDPGGNAILEADNGGSIYSIRLNQFDIWIESSGYVVSRVLMSVCGNDGYLGLVGGKVGVCCTLDQASGCGTVPAECVSDSIEELKQWAEVDYGNLEAGVDNVSLWAAWDREEDK